MVGDVGVVMCDARRLSARRIAGTERAPLALGLERDPHNAILEAGDRPMRRRDRVMAVGIDDPPLALAFRELEAVLAIKQASWRPVFDRGLRTFLAGCVEPYPPATCRDVKEPIATSEV